MYMPAQLFQVITLLADLAIFIFVAYYLLKLRTKEKTLERKEGKIDTNYHQIVDDALSKERKIIDDATHEADQIITGAHYIKHASKEAVDEALQRAVDDIQKEAAANAQVFTNSYQDSLKQLSTQSLQDYQNVIKELEANLQKQIK